MGRRRHRQLEFDEKGRAIINKKRVVIKGSQDKTPAIDVVTKPRPKKKWKFSSDGKFRWEIDVDADKEEQK